MNFPDWLTQPFLTDLGDVHESFRDELSEVQYDESARVVFKNKKTLMWLGVEIREKYPLLSEKARNLLLPFPTSYLVECGFSAVIDLLTKKRNRLEICERGDLRMKLTNLKPNIEQLVSEQQAQGSH
jgi:hypothetical protein